MKQLPTSHSAAKKPPHTIFRVSREFNEYSENNEIPEHMSTGKRGLVFIPDEF